jgi:hypothetical protein
MDERKREAPPEELMYARVLRTCVTAGLLILAFSFLLYMFGVPQPRVPVDQLPQYWGLPVDQFVKATHAPTGWAWLASLRNSDMLNMVGIALLAAASALSSLAVLPMLLRRSELAVFAIALLQIIVLAVSASNLLIGR